MRVFISGGGGPTFTVHNANRKDLEVSSMLTGYDAVRAVAEWLEEKPAPKDEPAKDVQAKDDHAKDEKVEPAKAEEHPVTKTRTVPPHGRSNG